MKRFLMLLSLLTTSAFAENLQIPTCNIKKNEELFKKLTSKELAERSNTFLHRMDNCDAAGSLYEIYQRGVDEKSKKDLFSKLFLSLKKGKFLNEYTGLLMGFKHELKSMNLEQISQDHAWIYTKINESRGRNSLSQFVHAGKNLSLMDEAEVNYKNFIKNYPKNPFAATLKKEIRQIHDQHILEQMDYVNFYQGKKTLDLPLMTVEVKRLSKILLKSSDSIYLHQGLNFLATLIPDTNLTSDQKAKSLAAIKKIIVNNGTVGSTVALDKIINPEEESKLALNPDEALNDFLIKKGEDRTVFLPLNRDYKFKSVQTLIGLGVVGILIAFDEPIMDVVQRTKDDPGFKETALYGNSFGEVSGLAPVILGTLGVGLVFNNDKAKNAAISALGAVLLGQLVIETMKSATHRSRPEDGKGAYDFGGLGLGSDNTSFASGHSAAAWSVASVFAEEFGDDHKWAPAVAYSIAALTSYSRMNKNKHWASDVVMGAMVGYVAGKVFHKIYRKIFKAKIENIHFSPMIGQTTGLRVTIQEKAYAELKRWPLDTYYHFQKASNEASNKDSKGLDAIYSEIYVN